MQDVILSLARPPRKYQKDLASSLNTMLCSSEKWEKSKGVQKSIEAQSLNFIFFVFNLCLVL
jgi:hypothetical protein